MNGVHRTIDPQKRIVLPATQLEAVGLGPGDMIVISAGQDDDGAPCIIIQAYDPGCVFCGAKEAEHKLFDRVVCAECATVIGAEATPLGEQKRSEEE